jgi:hypothetical protein
VFIEPRIAPNRFSLLHRVKVLRLKHILAFINCSTLPDLWINSLSLSHLIANKHLHVVDATSWELKLSDVLFVDQVFNVV